MRRLSLLFCTLLWIALFAPLVTHAQSQTVDEIIAVLESAAAALERGNAEDAERLLGTLQEAELPDGSVVALVDSGWGELLEQSPDEAATVLRELAQRLREPPASLPADSRDLLEEVLARPEFQDAQPSLLERFLRWLGELLPDASPDMRALADIAVGLFGILVIGLLVLFVVRMVRRYWREGEVLESLGEIPVHATEAQARAGEAAVAGDFREAMRLLYLAALLHLDEVGLLRFDRALTNREVLATVANHAPLYGTLAPVVAQFDRVWSGHAPFDAGDFERMEAQIEELRHMKRTARS